MHRYILIPLEPIVHARLEHAVVEARIALGVGTYVVGDVPHVGRSTGGQLVRTRRLQNHHAGGRPTIVVFRLTVPGNVVELPAG